MGVNGLFSPRRPQMNNFRKHGTVQKVKGGKDGTFVVKNC